MPRAARIRPFPLPARALLRRYTDAGAYTDCYGTEIPVEVTHARFVETFYTGRLFKLERLILAWLLSRPSSDEQARQLARGEINAFAAWRVEARATDQLLLRDIHGRTCSWLMVEPTAEGTRLYFGSAVMPVVDAVGRPRMGLAFRLLLGFHKAYSRALLWSARRRIASVPVPADNQVDET